MIKTNKRDLARLQDLSRGITQGLKALMSDKYAIMKRSNMSSTDIFTASFYPGDSYCRITKEIGNELVPMFTAIKELAKLVLDTPMNTEPYEPQNGAIAEIDIDEFHERLNQIM